MCLVIYYNESVEEIAHGWDRGQGDESRYVYDADSPFISYLLSYLNPKDACLTRYQVL